MVVAKLCGMRVERFSIFFGQADLVSFRRGETEYGDRLAAPRRLREDQRDDAGRRSSREEVEPRAYYNATPPGRSRRRSSPARP